MRKDFSLECFIELASDVVDSIEKACWVDKEGDPHLAGPTLHMRLAITNIKRYLDNPCPECGQPRRN